MNFRKILKFTFSGVLLAAGIYAYADGEVMLKDGSSVTWSAFVNAINDPKTVKGTLPEDAPSKIALKEAQDTLQSKQDAVTIAQDSVTAKKAAVTKAEAAVTKAIALRDSVAKIVAEKKKAYDDAEAQLTTWNTTMTELNNTLTNLTGQSTALSGDIDDANGELSALQTQYDDLEKETEQITTTVVTAKWLDDVYKASQAFKVAYGTGARPKDKNAVIYYEYFDSETTGVEDYDGAEELNLSFIPVEGLTSITVADFYNTFGKKGAKPVANIFVYLGEEYTDGYDGYMLIDGYSGTNTSIITAACNGVYTLATSPEYSKTTVSYKTTYKDPDAEAQLRQDIADKKEEIAGLRSQRQTVNGNITTTRTSMTTTQGLIDGYTKVPEGSAAGTLSQQAQLKKAWDDKVEVQNTFEQEVTDAQAAVTAAEKAVTDAQADVTFAQGNVTPALMAVNNAEAAVAAAQAEVDADAFANYNTITLTEDIATEETVTEAYSGTIWGEGHIFTAINSPIFLNFNGQINNAAVNGQFSKAVIGGTYANFARWDVENHTGRFYTETGAESDFQTLGELGFAARDYYGVDFSAKNLVAKTANSIVYNIAVYASATEENPTSYYVTQDGKALTALNAAGDIENVTLDVNVFAKSATNDLKGIDNIFYLNDGNYVSDNVKITDRQNFLCPEEISAANLVYDRTLTKGYNAVCLPFDLNYDENAVIDAICDYETVDSERFWFTKLNDTDYLPANTPGLVHAKEDINLQSVVANAKLAKTNAQIVEGTGTDKTTSQSFGIYKQQVNAGQIKGESNAGYIYGLTKSGKFQAGDPSVTFPAFRMVIWSQNKLSPTPTNAPSRAPGMVSEMGIGIHDQRGYDITEELITTGIETVTEAAATALEIVGGQGEISITSEANYGKVQIFTVDGRVAASANVVEGTTTVSLAHGLYIVMGQKVLVK